MPRWIGVISATLALLGGVLVGCVYPHRGTSLSLVRNPPQSLSAPEDVWALTIVSAQIAPRAPGNLPWDEGGGPPDAVVRVYRDGTLLFETPPAADSLNPEWNVRLPRNVSIPPTADLRFEVWDADTIGADPIGIFSHAGLPEQAVPTADARLMLPNGSFLTIRIDSPIAHRGVGIPEYEIQPGALVVVRVEPASPAGRAGLQAGDRIVAIGERRVAGMSEAQASSALSMAHGREHGLTVVGRNGRERTVELDRGFVWLTM
ncbi:MAG: PDZ domain-containing protein [Sandaracinaceae bacterium]|nr:PDZ domain-containing protein [Sandaracinaceae bacterium]